MEIRIRSTFDGAIVGTVSGLLLVLITGFWGAVPTNSPSDIVMTCLVAGAMVGWVMENAFRHYSFLGGIMTAFTTMFMMALGALPFALFLAMVGTKPLSVNGTDTTNAALALMLISAVVGILYQKIASQPSAIPTANMRPHQITVEN